MQTKHGDFTWYEIVAEDVAATQNFYSALTGWTWEESEGQPGMPYHLFSANGVQIGGMMALTDDMKANGAKPSWMGYIGVDDIEKSVDAIETAGGSIHIPPTPIPGIGQFSMVTDPQGAFFYVMQDTSGEESYSFAKTEPKVGHCAWNELMTSDPEGALAFYGQLFGWTKASEMDMGPMGKYHLLDHGYGLGGVMKKADEMPMSAWTFYFRVPDIDKAVDTIKAKRGQTMMDPMEIPGGDFTLSGIDPQGAFFSIIGKRQ